MLAKMTSKNQITIPKGITKQFPGKYFEVKAQGGSIILTPVNVDGPDQVRAKLEELGVTEQDVKDAVDWARK